MFSSTLCDPPIRKKRQKHEYEAANPESSPYSLCCPGDGVDLQTRPGSANPGPSPDCSVLSSAVVAAVCHLKREAGNEMVNVSEAGHSVLLG